MTGPRYLQISLAAALVIGFGTAFHAGHGDFGLAGARLPREWSHVPRRSPTGRSAIMRLPLHPHGIRKIPASGTIVRYDPRIDALIPGDARLERVAGGFTWVEGPAWNRETGYLLFSDIPRNAIYRWHEGSTPEIYLEPSGYTGAEPFEGREPGSNGLAFDANGRLLICEHGDRRIGRLEADGRRTVLADRYEGRRLNSPNDLAINSNGDVYFTDPPFGLPGTFQDPAKELPFSGVYRLSPDGGLHLVIRELTAPNGIAFSPTEETLYVSNADPDRPFYMAYDVLRDGSVARGRVFHDATELTRRYPGRGLPDGMKTDSAGNLFAAGPGGVHVFATDGSLLGSIITGVATSNVGWGGDGSDLYITASTDIYRIRLSTRGTEF